MNKLNAFAVAAFFALSGSAYACSISADAEPPSAGLVFDSFKCRWVVPVQLGPVKPVLKPGYDQLIVDTQKAKAWTVPTPRTPLGIEAGRRSR